MNLVKQSTSITAKVGPFIDEDDGKTAETGLTISQSDIRLSKNGGNYAQSNDSGGGTHDENGEYDITLDATDTNTVGRLRLLIHVSGALPVFKEYFVVPAEVYSLLTGGTQSLPGQGAPTATPSLVTAIMYLYKNWRNKKTQTATEFSLLADDATTVDQKATVSDDGTTATKGEMASGA